ncbi:TetR/AcrR family transcriptional regulator [Brevibacterium sp. CCUG 69071]|uniref:TetR/AcrR family transcriptional regulator n=1 Tax=Brevibacterium sp. CCUG 69071 TaxID=2052937 RepID=UPI001E480AA8|nr:TetR/AcrR family transcriptional regulator C-terminal domain-containing protein [Brevibacterium sp. CCUG 69071]
MASDTPRRPRGESTPGSRGRRTPRSARNPRAGSNPRDGSDPRDGRDPRAGRDPRDGRDPRSGAFDPRAARAERIERSEQMRRSGRQDPRRRGGRGQSRTRASLSLDQIIEAAIATLDAVGAEKVTLRGLAAQLDSGVASLYWYASGKDELMAIVADELLGRALDDADALIADGLATPPVFAAYPEMVPAEATSTATAEALRDVRRLVLCLFVQMIEHRWLAGQLIKAGPDEHNSLSYWERIGQALQRTELDLTSQFHASLTVVNYASGMGAEVSQSAIDRESMEDTEAEFAEQIDRWASFDEEEFPFVHSVLGEFAKFDEKSEFIVGLDLVLSGIERLSWG